MPSSKTTVWIERWVWICIYAGLLLIVAALVTQNAGSAMQALVWLLGSGGAALVILGLLLLWLRSRQGA